MSSAALAQLSDSLVYFTIVTYVVAAILFGFEFAFGTRWMGRAAMAVTVVGLGLNIGTSVARGLAAHRVPWGNMYEVSVLAGSFTVAAFLIWVVKRPVVRSLGAFLLLAAALVVGIGRILLFAPAGPLVPSLQSGWLMVHVTSIMFASSMLVLSSLFSILYLVKERHERRSSGLGGRPALAGGARTADSAAVQAAVERHAGASRRGGRWSMLWDRLPSSRVLDELAYKTTAFAFPIWTFGLIAGAIWAESAWSRFWGWDPKETWSLIVWLVYATYLHARATSGWRGRRAAMVSVLGLACLMFDFYAVNLWIVGLHSYAGVSG